MEKKYYIGVDLGGTKVAIGIVNQDGELLEQTQIPTVKEEAKLAKNIYETAKTLLNSRQISFDEILSMGIGVPGTVDKKKRVIVYANNLDFVMVPMVELLEQYVSFPVYMDNDANAAAWAEYKAGAGKGKNVESMVMVTLGTGVGAGFVIHDRIFGGCNEGAGEIGHMVIDRKGIPCNCGRRGCFENYASTTALLEQAKEAMEVHKDSILWELCQQNIQEINGKLFFEAVRKKDQTACEVLCQFQEYLTTGLLNLINLFQPDFIVIGGGISKVGDLLLEPVRKEIAELVYTKDDAVQTQIEQAVLGNEAGIIGAALLHENS